AQITRNGMAIDRDFASKAEISLRQGLADSVAEVRALCPALFKTDRQGNLKHTATGTPSKSKKLLLEQLQKISEEAELDVPVTGKTRTPTTSTKFWAEHRDLHPFLGPWIAVEEQAQLLQFWTRLEQDRVHPHYGILKKTGRTSASQPNVQQVPKDGPFRQAFV